MRGCVGAIIVVVVNFLRILVRAWQHFVAIRKETVKTSSFWESIFLLSTKSPVDDSSDVTNPDTSPPRTYKEALLSSGPSVDVKLTS